VFKRRIPGKNSHDSPFRTACCLLATAYWILFFKAPIMDSPQETVLITGSSGRIGYAAAKRLLSRYRVVGLDREDALDPLPHAESIKVDVTSEESMRSALSRVKEKFGSNLASVIHLAAFYDFAGNPSPLYQKVNIEATERLFQHLHDFEVGQFIYTSTMLVHRPCRPGDRIHEESPLEPKWDYPKSKLTSEKMLHATHGEIPLVVLRPAAVYDEEGHSIPLTTQIQRVFERDISGYVFPGDLRHGASFLHMDDLLDGIERAVERRRELPPEVTMLMGEEDVLSYDEVQRAAGRLLHGVEWQTWRIPKLPAKVGMWIMNTLSGGESSFLKPWMVDIADDHYALDVSHVRTLLGWEPKRSLRDTLPRILASLKADPVHWYETNKLKMPKWLENHREHGIPAMA
jgi:nucleoside-diphosphate-sugar epimerase